MSRRHDLEAVAAAISALAAGNGVFLGLGFAVVAYTSWSRSRHSAAALKKVESTPVTPLSDVKSLLEGPGKGNQSGSSSEGAPARSDSSGHLGPSDLSTGPTFAIVRGEVQPRAGWKFYGGQDEVPLRSEFAPEEAARCVITRKTQTYGHIELDGSFRVREAPMSDLLKQIPFVLRDSRARDTRLHVDWLGSPKDGLPLECVYRHFQPGAASGTQAFIFLVFGQSCPVGVVTEERVLKVGTELTALGHLYKSGDGLSIRPAGSMPLFLTRMTKDEVVAALKIERLFHRWTGILTGLLAGGIFAYATGRLCFRVYREWKRRRNLYRNPRPPGSSVAQQAASPPEPVNDDEDDVAPPGEACVVCLTRTRRAVFLNCGHRAACFPCAQRVADGRGICPLCRQAIVGVVRVYDP
ncbi:RING/U-box superfamily protein [Klebsormidium nitens]|uniref:RING-type E3 ubiquitin transferase n=1 Tax=Klebsormidium nitens TaxID=105231 RepID=A0A1Y1IH36_KLENI|nr:RING/U-box superfamily protein [Klebsormidium nitens]|eukprot:GAQ88371.1 RING/U-box superfamily protein [Klebsormidium nitens]